MDGKLIKSWEVHCFPSPERAINWTIVTREYVGGDRYARDYEYCDAQIMPRLKRAYEAGLSTPSPERAEGATAGEVKEIERVIIDVLDTFHDGLREKKARAIAAALSQPSQVGKEEARELRLGGVDHETARRVNLADLGYRGGVSDEAREEIARAELRAGLVLSTAEQYVFKGASLQERPDYPPPCPAKGLDEDDVAHIYDAAWAEIEGEASNWCSVRKVRLRRLIDAYAALSSPPAPEDPELYGPEIEDVLAAIAEHRDDTAEAWTVTLSAGHWRCLEAVLRGRFAAEQFAENANCPPAPAAEPVAIKTVGWAALARNGNIRFWHADEMKVHDFACRHSCDVVRLVETPRDLGVSKADREEIARIIDPEAWEEYLLEDGRVDEEVASIFQDAYEASLAKADAILAKLSPGEEG